MRRSIFLLVGLLLLGPATVQAQYDYGHQGYGVYDDYWDYYGYHSSTAQEGYGRGLADMIRSQGIYNRLSAEALVKQEEARRRYIENYKEGVDTYLQTRALNREYRAAEQAERREEVREWLENRTPHQPRRLSPSELDPTTGHIDWPILLQDGAYSELREMLERTFRQRANQGGSFGPDSYETVLTTGEQMLQELKERIHDVSPGDYIAAKRFIQALTNEAQFPAS